MNYPNVSANRLTDMEDHTIYCDFPHDAISKALGTTFERFKGCKAMKGRIDFTFYPADPGCNYGNPDNRRPSEPEDIEVTGLAVNCGEGYKDVSDLLSKELIHDACMDAINKERIKDI